MTTDIILDKEQEAAVDCALSRNVMVLTGGPGTGKTTVCKEIIEQLEASGSSVVCAAPTGKAAKRLQEQTRRPACTVHRLLGWSFETDWFIKNRHDPIDANVVLIDESSMLDIEMIYAILEAMRFNAKLILVGDADQLPSISAGNVLRDIIASNAVPVVRLTQVHRQSPNSWICQNAAYINRGVQIHVDNENSEDFFVIEREEKQEASDTIVRLVTQVIHTRHEGIDPIRDIQVLCPQKKGDIGTKDLNPKLQGLLNPPHPNKPEWKMGAKVFRLGDRVIHTKNNYQLNVFNGEVGTITDIGDVMTVDFGDHGVNYDKSDTVHLQLCYATTIHKAQGSEYPCVVVAIHSSNHYMLSRPLFYTAVTRAQKFVYVVGNQRGINRAITNNEIVLRHTSLRERLEYDLPNL